MPREKVILHLVELATVTNNCSYRYSHIILTRALVGSSPNDGQEQVRVSLQ